MIAFHALLLRPQAWVLGVGLMVLIAGAVCRWLAIFPPRWLAWLILFAGLLAPLLSPAPRYEAVIGEMAALAAAGLLLRPLSLGRGQWVLFLVLLQLLALILKPFPNVGVIFIILDVAVVFLLAEQICRPAEAVTNFWASLLQSIRLVVPVGVIVSLAFWLFPSLSQYTPAAFIGFSGANYLDPGSIVELAQSRRTAFTARFANDSPLPEPRDLYWRGQVLEVNEGLRWSRMGRRLARESILRMERPPDENRLIRYTQEMERARGSLVPVLDHAVFLEAWRDGEPVTILDSGGAVLSVVGAGPLSLDVISSASRLSDAPIPLLDQGATAVPEEVASSPLLQGIARRLFSGQPDAPAKLAALAAYFQSSGFQYSRRPGKVRNLEKFLDEQKRGFCEHYAVAAANLLRLAGVPTRVITGYRGGQWNAWNRTMTLRDANAHAWIEAWDANSGQWLRFDPTQFVAPALDDQIEAEMDFASWPWYRKTWTWSQAAAGEAADAIARAWNNLLSPEAWERLNQILLWVVFAGTLFWFLRVQWKRRSHTPAETAVRLLGRVERRAMHRGRGRLPGETPLAWFGRLASQADSAEKNVLQLAAASYEKLVYQFPDDADIHLAAFRVHCRVLLRQWRRNGPTFRSPPGCGEPGGTLPGLDVSPMNPKQRVSDR